MPRKKSFGFTLVELMVVIAIAAILAAIAFPSFQGTLRRNRVATANNAVIAALSEARGEAIRNTRGAGVCGSTAGTSCDGTFANGWLIYSDLDGNGSFNGNDVAIRFERPANGLTVSSASAGHVLFDARGRRRTTSVQTITLQPSQPSSCGSEQLRRNLAITPAGQIQTVKATCS